MSSYVRSEELSNCNKVWDMTNNVNNHPMYSMGLYMCIETTNGKTLSLPAPHIHEQLLNKTKHILNYDANVYGLNHNPLNFS